MEGYSEVGVPAYYSAVLNGEAEPFCSACAGELITNMHKMMDGNGDVFNYEEE